MFEPNTTQSPTKRKKNLDGSEKNVDTRQISFKKDYAKQCLSAVWVERLLCTENVSSWNRIREIGR